MWLFKNINLLFWGVDSKQVVLMANYFKVDLSTIGSENDVKTKIILPLLKQVGIVKYDNEYYQEVPVKITSGRKKETKFADIVIYLNSAAL